MAVWGRVVGGPADDSTSELLIERTDNIEWRFRRLSPEMTKPPYRITFRSTAGDQYFWCDAQGVESVVGNAGRPIGRFQIEWRTD